MAEMVEEVVPSGFTWCIFEWLPSRYQEREALFAGVAPLTDGNDGAAWLVGCGWLW